MLSLAATFVAKQKKTCVNRASLYNFTVCIISGEESCTLNKTAMNREVHI